MWFKRENKLKRWVDLYVESRAKRYPIAVSSHADWLALFMETCDKEITDITEEDIGAYMRYVDERYSGIWARNEAIRAVSCFLRFHRGRGHRYLPSLNMVYLLNGRKTYQEDAR